MDKDGSPRSGALGFVFSPACFVVMGGVLTGTAGRRHKCNLFNSPVTGAFGVPYKLKIFIVAMSLHLPHRMPARARKSRRVITKVAKGLIEADIQENNDGKSGRDILTSLGAFLLWSSVNICPIG